MFAPASRHWRTLTDPSRAPRASAETSRCPRNSYSGSDAGSSARQTDHGRDQEQHDRDEEDDLGVFDRGSGDTAKAQNARDQGNDQKRNDPAQHDMHLLFPRSGSSISAITAPHRLQNQSGLETKVPASSGRKTCAKNGEPRNKIRPGCARIKPVKSAATGLYALQSCYEGSPSRPRGAIVGGRRFE